MMNRLSIGFLALSMIGAVGLAACSGNGSGSTAAGGSSTTAGSGGDAQTPPQGAANVQAWLATGQYKSWKCETAVHASRSPSPHGFNRICSNGLIESTPAATAVWPKGAAAVKELYNAATDTTPVGYAVYLKTAAASAAGAAWYWYEQVPADSMAPHDSKGIVADGLGGSGPPDTICVGCHVAAGMDAAHTPSPGGRDFVYTPVM
jgi:hypothetical protein